MELSQPALVEVVLLLLSPELVLALSILVVLVDACGSLPTFVVFSAIGEVVGDTEASIVIQSLSMMSLPLL